MPCDDFMNGIHTHTHVQSHIECTHGSPRCSPDQQKHLNKYLRFGWTWGSSSTSSSLVISSAWCVFTFGRTIFHTPNTLCISNGPRRCTSLSLSVVHLLHRHNPQTSHFYFISASHSQSMAVHCCAALHSKSGGGGVGDANNNKYAAASMTFCVAFILLVLFCLSSVHILFCLIFVTDRLNHTHSLTHAVEQFNE